MTRVLFVCPDLNKPAGGIKQIYRQVEVLNKHNINAYVLHAKKPFRVTWFENNVPVLWDFRVDKIENRHNSLRSRLISTIKAIARVDSKELGIKKDVLDLNENDILVLPEFYGKSLNNVFTDYDKVVYNQNCYYTFRGYGFSDTENKSIYFQNKLRAVIVASQDAMGYMGMFLREKPLFRVKYGIDDKVFTFQSNKKRQIAFMPRKLREDSVQILNIMNQRGSLKGWEIKPIEGLDEQGVAEVLKDSAIFLSFNYREGFGMPPAEAMACGCIVVGYTGQGGNEIFNPEFSFPVKDRDIVSFIKTLENVLLSFDNDNEGMRIKSKKASEFILGNYSMKDEEETIINTWKKILPV